MSYRGSSVEIGLRHATQQRKRYYAETQEQRAENKRRTHGAKKAFEAEPHTNQHISDAYERERSSNDAESELASGRPQRFGNRQLDAALEGREPRSNRGDGAAERASWITQERKKPSQPLSCLCTRPFSVMDCPDRAVFAKSHP
jgi:hypothetical protein